MSFLETIHAFLSQKLTEISPSLLPQMVSLRSIFQLSFFAAASPNSSGLPKLQWRPCNATEVSSTVPIVCGNLGVPLITLNPVPTKHSYSSSPESQLLCSHQKGVFCSTLEVLAQLDGVLWVS
jgi:hypothetical protein